MALRGLKRLFRTVFIAAFSFAGAQFLSSNYLGTRIARHYLSPCLTRCDSALLKFWQPKVIFRSDGKAASFTKSNHHICKIYVAWSPFVILVLVIVLWIQPFFKVLFEKDGLLAFSNFYFEFNNISNHIFKSPPFVESDQSASFPVVFKFFLINTVGTSIFLVPLLLACSF
ncbi:L-lactate permease [Helicobacter pylori]